MARTPTPLLVLAALSLALAAAGCGGGDDKGGESAVSATAHGTTTTVPVITTANKGLARAQWTRYTTAAAAFEALNASTLDTVAGCADKQPGALLKCAGAPLDKLAPATIALGAVLAGSANSVGGSCQAALGALINYVVPYEGSLAALQAAVKSGDAAAVSTSVSSLQDGREAGESAGATVEQVCAP